MLWFSMHLLGTAVRRLWEQPIRLLQIPAFLLWTFGLATVAMTTVSLGIWAGDHLMPRIWVRVSLWMFRIRVTVLGRDRFAPAGTYVIVTNHVSALDPFLVIVATKRMPRFVAKAAVARIPIFGRAFRKLGHIVIDRNDPPGAYRTLAEAGRRLGTRYSVYFAPEGTRSRRGNLLPFRDGPFVYAQQAGLPVLPAVVTGTRALWPPDRGVPLPGTAVIEFGNPVAVPENDADAVKNEVHAWMRSRLRAAADKYLQE